MYCRNCGNELREDVAFCPTCGAAADGTGNHCAYCGAELVEHAVVCSKCGMAVDSVGDADTPRPPVQPLTYPAPVVPAGTPKLQLPQPKHNGFAIAGFVLGIVSFLSFFVCGGIFLPLGVVGIVLSAVALKQKQQPKGLAVTGLILSILSAVVLLLFVFAIVFNVLIDIFPIDQLFA